MMCTYAPLASPSGLWRSDHDQIEGDILARIKNTKSIYINDRR